MLKSPKVFVNALLASDVDFAVTRLHHIIAFAGVVQVDCFIRGSHAPLFLQLLGWLRKGREGAKERSKIKLIAFLIDAVNYGCALLASQGYTFKHDPSCPLKCHTVDVSNPSCRIHSAVRRAALQRIAQQGASGSTGQSTSRTVRWSHSSNDGLRVTSTPQSKECSRNTFASLVAPSVDQLSSLVVSRACGCPLHVRS